MDLKNYVLDTNVLVSSPHALLSFDEHNVYVTSTTLEELDHLKSRPGELGANARAAIRLIDEAGKSGDLMTGAQLANGGRLHLLFNPKPDNGKVPEAWGKSPDNTILQACLDALETIPDLTLVSNDVVMRLKASVINLTAEEYRSEQMQLPPDQRYKGRRELIAGKELIDRLYNQKQLSQDDTGALLEQNDGKHMSLNEYALLRDMENPKHTALARYTSQGLVCLETARPYGISPKNVGQHYAIDALMAPANKTPLVILQGPAGTAKTFLALAAGLEQVEKDQMYTRILVARPNIKFDEDIGYLKGSEEEKISPLIRPIMDNLEVLCKAKKSLCNTSYVQELFDQETIVAQALAYIRGRSISDTWIIIDEAQNMTPIQAFGIISRVGIGSKVVLAGDPDQIDNPALDRKTNGLTYASERMRGSPLCAQVAFEDSECVRSQLAVEAIKRLSPKGYRLEG